MILVVSGLLSPSGLIALDIKPDEIRTKTKERSISVLHNRFFKKRFRPELGLFAGTITNEAFLDTFLFGVRASIFVSEWFGLDIQYASVTNSDSRDFDAIQMQEFDVLDVETSRVKTERVDVHRNRVSTIIEGSAVMTPFYGKLNFFDLAIIYTDIYGSIGIGSVNTDQGNKIAPNFGFGIRLYLYKFLSLRVDVKDRFWNETNQFTDEDFLRQSWSVDAGVSVFFL